MKKSFLVLLAILSLSSINFYGQAKSSFPTGCWKFTYVDPDSSNFVYMVFRDDNKFADLTVNKESGKLVNWNTFGWKLKNSNEITLYSIDMTGAFFPLDLPLRYDGTKLRQWYLNDQGDTPSNMRYYGVPDNGCSKYIDEMKQNGGKW